MKIAKYYQQYSAAEFHMLKNGFHFSKKKMTVSRTSMSIDRCKPHTILKTKCQNMRNTKQKINYKKTNNLFLYTLWYLEKQIVFVIFSFYFVILLTKFNNVFFCAIYICECIFYPLLLKPVESSPCNINSVYWGMSRN